ncbi:MAG: YIP1 family protein [Paracoccaceae bacterium]
MAVATDIFRSWMHPRQVMQEQLAGGVREDRALAFLMGACLLIFVSQWPKLARMAELQPDKPLEILLGGALMAWLFIAPLALYLIAALSHVLARIAGGHGSWFTARMALFWSLLVVTPIWLLNGLVAGMFGAGAILTVTGGLAFFAFIVIWIASLIEAESRSQQT